MRQNMLFVKKISGVLAVCAAALVSFAALAPAVPVNAANNYGRFEIEYGMPSFPAYSPLSSPVVVSDISVEYNITDLPSEDNMSDYSSTVTAEYRLSAINGEGLTRKVIIPVGRIPLYKTEGNIMEQIVCSEDFDFSVEYTEESYGSSYSIEEEYANVGKLKEGAISAETQADVYTFEVPEGYTAFVKYVAEGNEGMISYGEEECVFDTNAAMYEVSIADGGQICFYQQPISAEFYLRDESGALSSYRSANGDTAPAKQTMPYIDFWAKHKPQTFSYLSSEEWYNLAESSRIANYEGLKTSRVEKVSEQAISNAFHFMEFEVQVSSSSATMFSVTIPAYPDIYIYENGKIEYSFERQWGSNNIFAFLGTEVNVKINTPYYIASSSGDRNSTTGEYEKAFGIPYSSSLAFALFEEPVVVTPPSKPDGGNMPGGGVQYFDDESAFMILGVIILIVALGGFGGGLAVVFAVIRKDKRKFMEGATSAGGASSRTASTAAADINSADAGVAADSAAGAQTADASVAAQPETQTRPDTNGTNEGSSGGGKED